MFLPSRLYLLLLTRSSHLYPDLSWLRLHAWRLSSAFHEQLASPPLSRSSLHWRAVHPRSQCIRYIGPFIMGSVTPMAIPFIILYGSRFLCSFWYTGSLGVSSLRGYRSVLSAVFRFHLPSLSSDQVLRMLFRSFQLSSAECVLRPHTWDLSMVLPI